MKFAVNELIQGRSCFFTINNKECSKLAEESYTPGNGIGNIEALGCVECGDLEYGINPEDSKAADSENRDNHGRC